MLNYRQFIVLYVDDEELSLKSFSRAFGDQFQILTANSAEGGLRLIDEHADRIAVLMTDQRMPGMKGVNLLEQARQIQPRILRILVTAYADIEAAVQAVNSGAIYKYVHKPWDPPSLETLLRRAIEFFQLQRERDQLLKEKTSLLRNMMVADRLVSLGLLAAGLSHHIRNSLVSVKTFLDLAPIKLAEEGVDPAAMRHADFWGEYLDSVQGQIDRINGLLRDRHHVHAKVCGQPQQVRRYRSRIAQPFEWQLPGRGQKIEAEVRIEEVGERRGVIDLDCGALHHALGAPLRSARRPATTSARCARPPRCESRPARAAPPRRVRA